MMPALLRTLLLLCVAFGAADRPAHAQDQAFFEARQTWLEGDDAASLPRLAELARQGHRAARLLLGRIEVTDRVLSPYRRALSPREARTLFRKTEHEGAFGRSWLSVEAERGNALATLLLRAKQPQPDPGLIADLFGAGEYEAADHSTRILALYGTKAQKQALLEGGPLIEDLRPYVTYLLGTPEPRGDGLAALRHITDEDAHANDPEALAMAGTLALGWGFGSLDPKNPWYGQVAA